MSEPRPALWSINGRFLTQPQTGVQRYAGEMTRAIDVCLARDEPLTHRMRWEILLPADCEHQPAFDALKVRRSGVGRGHVWEQTILPFMARGGLLSFANLGPIAHTRHIVCMHDANVFLEPASYSRRFRTAYKVALPILARQARAVTTVSTFSAAMLRRAGVNGARPCEVIANGHEHALRWDAAKSPFAAPERFARPFVFALGSRARHKQVDLLLGLAPALDALGIDLVLAGGSASIFAGMASADAPNVHHVGFVGDDDLAALFQRALCFAFPSRTEGFGLPLVEAMVHGAPIVASGCASMPEVCGKAALYAAPDRPADWLDQIGRLHTDPDLRADLVAAGKARYPRFSWMSGAKAYLALAQRVSFVRDDRTHRVAPPIRPTAF